MFTSINSRGRRGRRGRGRRRWETRRGAKRSRRWEGSRSRGLFPIWWTDTLLRNYKTTVLDRGYQARLLTQG